MAPIDNIVTETPVMAPYAMHLSSRCFSDDLSRPVASERMISVVAASSKRNAADRLCNPSMDQTLLMADHAVCVSITTMEVVNFRGHRFSLMYCTRQTKQAAKMAADGIC